ncbi:Mut7-C RNAse domain-containing protein [Streptomyces sodiiphilus]|uniref:Mut7-C RNAse domain-containing protein n=1 Tax=Streptomyces sodiiphilus TaxID=226217 RepID=A0ABN2P2Z5_9ACTN
MTTLGGGPPGTLLLRPDPRLRFFLPARLRAVPELAVPDDGTSSLGHVVQSVGIPLSEVGALTSGDRPLAASHRPVPGERVSIEAVRRPERLPPGPPRFLLDVHLGALARRLRLVGLDTECPPDAGDAALVARAGAERRILLTRDRGVLMRRRLWRGAFVRGDRPDDQLTDVLDRFAPPLAPWTRCPACNGLLEAADRSEVERLLRPGTRRTYDAFSRCASCGRVFWRGAHGERLRNLVEAANRTVVARLAEAGHGHPAEMPGGED